jgi:hypothetical protein
LLEIPPKNGSILRSTIFPRCANHKLRSATEWFGDAKKFIAGVRASYAQNAATWRAVPWTHIDVGKQWTRDAALRRAAHVVFATSRAPFSVIAAPVLVGAFNHSLISRNHGTIHDATGRGFEEVVVRRCAGTLL